MEILCKIMLVIFVALLLGFYFSENLKSFSKISTMNAGKSVINISNKLIIFIHFHKAGGSTISHLFTSDKKINPYKPNGNGNPHYENGTYIPITDFSQGKLNNFIEKTKEQNVNFLAQEYNYFQNSTFLDFSYVKLITCIRDPYERFISNYRNRANANTDIRTYIAYNRTRQPRHQPPVYFTRSNKPNYYVAMLNGLGNQPDAEINREHLEKAKKELHNFVAILILENLESYKMLEILFGIPYKGTHKNKTKKNKEKVNLTKEEFKKTNELDFELYEYAKNLSEAQLKYYEFENLPKN